MKNVKDSLFNSSIVNLKEIEIENVPLMFADTISLNRNYYPSKDVKEAVDKFNKITNSIDPTFRYMLIRHPKIKEQGDGYVKLEEADISYEKVAGWLEEIRYNDRTKTVYGKIKILNTPQGLIIRYLYEKGYPIGFSARISHKELQEEYDRERNFTYFVKKGLTIKGFDFVINPAFALTWVKKEEVDSVESVIDELSDEIINYYSIRDDIYKESIENIIKDVCITCGCELDEACGLYTASVESEIVNKDNKIQVNDKKLNMDSNILYGGNKMPEDRSFLEVEKLRLERDKLATEKEKLEFELLKLQSQKEALEQKVKELEEKDKELSDKVYSKDSEFKIITKKLAEYEEKAKELEIVPPSEKVSTKAWGDIPKLPIRKAVWLSNNKRVIREAFGVLDEGWEEDYTQLKYPHHELQPSDAEGYDLDLVLNINGLRTAMLFALGRAGMYLTPEQKRALGRHLMRHYRELVKAGVVEDIPDGVKTLSSVENVVIEAENDEVLTNIIDAVITKGFLKIDIPSEDEEENDEIADGVESVVVDVDDEGNPVDEIKIKKLVISEDNVNTLYSDISLAVFKALFGSDDDETDIESLMEQFDLNEMFKTAEEEEGESQEGMDEGQMGMRPEEMGMGMNDQQREGEEPEEGEPTDVADENTSNIEKIHEAIRRFAEKGATPLEKYDVDGQDINKTKTFLLTLRELFTQPDTFETAVVLFLQLKSIYDATMFFARTFVGALRELEETNQVEPSGEEGEGETVAQDNVDNQDVENKTSEDCTT